MAWGRSPFWNFRLKLPALTAFYYDSRSLQTGIFLAQFSAWLDDLHSKTISLLRVHCKPLLRLRDRLELDDMTSELRCLEVWILCVTQHLLIATHWKDFSPTLDLLHTAETLLCPSCSAEVEYNSGTSDNLCICLCLFFILSFKESTSFCPVSCLLCM